MCTYVYNYVHVQASKVIINGSIRDGTGGARAGQAPAHTNCKIRHPEAVHRLRNPAPKSYHHWVDG